MSAPAGHGGGIAIVGMAGRFPKAPNITEFWRGLCAGAEGISFFEDEKAEGGAASPNGRGDNYVRARGILEGADLFDAAFFGITPREAEILDPQHRVFLECSWEALENAGYDATRFDGAIGVFAGAGMNTYLMQSLRAQPDLFERVGEHQVLLGNDKDFLASRVSYKLDLRGPSVSIQAACSTSLVAICVACQNLLNFECDMALAGAVAISFPQKKGYVHQSGGIMSADGHCRPFDENATGTVAGEGVGVVVLRRLDEAVEAGDTIYAVIRGFALNNDGARKMSFSAPSIEGQAEVIATAREMAGFSPKSISYVEAHGTATPLGDPIEIEGLRKAFGADDAAITQPWCALGSVKSNIGHLDTAAGVAGLIKTALSLHHKTLPPSLHFQSPNSKIDFAHSPFYVNAALTDWKRNGTPRRAGVSCFGIGGTNAHVVLEESPELPAGAKSRPAQLLQISARTDTALEQAAADLAGYLKENPEINLADAAHTLRVGRKEFPHRRIVVCQTASEAVDALESRDLAKVATAVATGAPPPVVFMFPGQGCQRVGMGMELYQHEPVFRRTIDRCSDFLRPEIGRDLRSILYPKPEHAEEAARELAQTAMTQPALFVFEYALATLWMSWGIKPEIMIGHSLGEYTAACVAGVFLLEDALTIVATRGRMMQRTLPGAMLAVRATEEFLRPLLGGSLSIAAINAPSVCVVSGPAADIENLRQTIDGQGIPFTPLRTSHACHSAMMDPMLKPFAALVGKFNLNPPRIPFVSGVTGALVTPGQAIDPLYWSAQVRSPVRYAAGLAELFKDPARVYLEVGPDRTLGGLAKQHPGRPSNAGVVSSLGKGGGSNPETGSLLSALGHLWLAGVAFDGGTFCQFERRRRVPLPSYPFERKRFWVSPVKSAAPETNETLTDPAANRIPSPFRPPIDAVMTRGERIAASLRESLIDLSGLNLSPANDNARFAELGVESLLLTQFSLGIEKRFGVRVAFRQLLEELSTLAAVSTHIEGALAAGARNAGAADVPGNVTILEIATGEAVTIPLTESQRDLWVASQMSEAASCGYNESRQLRLNGSLNTSALLAALQQLIARHEALRTVFAPSGECQKILPVLGLEVPTIDLSSFAADDRAARLDEALAREARQPFDLVNGPLFRAGLFRLEPEKHVLVFTVHHIICDGHSLGVVCRELGALYDAARETVPARLPVAPSLREYVAAQTELARDGARAGSNEAYWLAKFTGEAPVLNLPVDQQQSSPAGMEGGHATLILSRALNEDLKRAGARRNCTMFTLLLGAYALWLRKLAGQTDVVVGIPVADRGTAGAESLVAHCVNFLPVRLAVDDDKTFAELLHSTRTTFLDAHEHQHFPFGRLVQKLNLPRTPDRMPLVSVTFNVERMGDPPRFAGLETELAPNPHGRAGFDLVFNVTEMDGALRLDCRFNASLFLPATINRWLDHFRFLLEQIAADREIKISDLSPLTGEEQREILVTWNETDTDYERGKCVHQLFEEQAARTPDAEAVVGRHERLTYRELAVRAGRLAARLRECGVGPDVPVAVCLDRSPRMLVGLLGILKAGGAYVPLDPAHPASRLKLILENSRAAFGITRRVISEQPDFPADACRWIDIDDESPARQRSDADKKPALEPGPENLAYIVHTSGSTGRPKGVAVEHHCVVNFVSWARALFQPGDLAGVLFSTSICFDISALEMFVTLCSGGKLIVAENALELPDLPARNEVTLINTVPSAANELLRLEAIPASTRVLSLGGELVKSNLVDRLYAGTGVERIYDFYGPSETTIYSTCALRQSAGPATIGRPIANTRAYVLDERLRPVPIGVRGELYLGGDGLARGYLHQPAMTAEKFIADSPYGRIYRTGDFARWLPDGTIAFLGRTDHQVKIRGHRIEAGEIEAALTTHPAVRECAVLPVELARDEKCLVAYLATAAGVVPTDKELRTFLQTKLPDYMVPSAFVFLPALPLNVNGKIDRRALPAPGPSGVRRAEEVVAPRTPAEEALAGIWREVLQVENVGVTDSFFDLGGHSLLAVRLVAQIEKSLGRKIPVAAVFQSPTIAQLAELLDARDPAANTSDLVAIQPRGSQPPLFLVHGIGGGMFWGYNNLARHLGPDQPVYAFKSRGMDGRSEIESIVEMAATYAAELRARHPVGPYRLGGYCFGGNVAFEMARQLAARGCAIESVVLINCVPPNSSYNHFHPTPGSCLKFLKNLGYWAAYLRHMDPQQRRDFLHWKVRAVRKRLGHWFEVKKPELDIDEFLDLSAQSDEQRKLWEIHIRALMNHHTKPYSGPVALYRTRGHSTMCSFDDSYGWREYAQNLSLRIAPGAHESVLDEPHVGALAEMLGNQLNESRSAGTGGAK